MLNKVVFVEDEIVTREGIRDHVDWSAYGFQLCGDAPDGELALQLLQTTKPDLLITDIKMPFMDGLELCRIVRERMPWIKVVILSGHDEFEYAREAIKLGVTEYLLKPVTPQDLHRVLQKIAALLAAERAAQDNERRLRDRLAEHQAAARENFLAHLLLGAVAPGEAIETSQALGLDLVARFYLVAIVKAALPPGLNQSHSDEHCRGLQMVATLAATSPGVSLIRMDPEKLVLLMGGDAGEDLERERDQLLESAVEAARQAGCGLHIGAGSLKNRIAQISQSFFEALTDLQINERTADANAEEAVPGLAPAGQGEPGAGSATSPYAALIRQAKEYIEQRYADPDLLLNEVAAHVNLSPSHFSVVFSREARQTFKDYLTAIRIARAKELLHTTGLQSAEIAYQIGYRDPHYFSHVFRKNTGMTPTEFRARAVTP